MKALWPNGLSIPIALRASLLPVQIRRLIAAMAAVIAAVLHPVPLVFTFRPPLRFLGYVPVLILKVDLFPLHLYVSKRIGKGNEIIGMKLSFRG